MSHEVLHSGQDVVFKNSEKKGFVQILFVFFVQLDNMRIMRLVLL